MEIFYLSFYACGKLCEVAVESVNFECAKGVIVNQYPYPVDSEIKEILA